MVKFREITSKSGKKILAGKDAESNEALVKQAGENEIVLHTAKPGSPFVNIKRKAGKRDIHEAAVFCARFSRDWKKNRKDVEVHYFFGKNIFKDREMKLGTFGVHTFKKIIAEKGEIEGKEK